MTVFSVWAKRLAALCWFFAYLYGAGYFLGRIAPLTLYEYLLLGSLLLVGLSLVIAPLCFIWWSQSSKPKLTPSANTRYSPNNMAFTNVAWEILLKRHEEEFKELAKLPQAIEGLYKTS